MEDDIYQMMGPENSEKMLPPPRLEANQFEEAEKIPEGQKRLAFIKLCEKKVGCFTMFIVLFIAALEVLQMAFSHENSSLFFDLLNKTINNVK